MPYSHILLVVLSLLFSVTNALATENNTPSKRFTALRVFDMEYATDPQISPNGKKIAYVRHSMDRINDKDKGQIWLLDIKE
jgi:acylaminoacyl-peptidase